MADRMDEPHGPPIGGLSIWVGLASFFSNSSDRAQARDALKKAKEAEKLQNAKEREKEGGEKGRRFGSWFRSSGSKKSKDE
jgi:hypothetical protein